MPALNSYLTLMRSVMALTLGRELEQENEKQPAEESRSDSGNTGRIGSLMQTIRVSNRKNVRL